MTDPSERSDLSDRSVWAPSQRLLTVGLIGLVTAVAFEGMAVPTILPAMVAELGQLELYGWAFSAFWLTNIIGITLAGGDADRHGPGRAFVVGAVLFAVGLLISGVAPSMPIVIAGRAVQGFGSGAIGAVVYVVIARGYAPPAMPRMIAFLSSAWVVPGLVGPALAGLVAQQLSWRWVFAGLAPAVLVMGLTVLRPIAALGRSEKATKPVPSEPGGRGRRAVDAVRLALGSTALLAGLTRPNGIMLSLVLGILALAPLRRRERGWLSRTSGGLLVAATPAIGMLLYCSYIYRLTGNPFAWVEAQAAWGRNFGATATHYAWSWRTIADEGVLAYIRAVPTEAVQVVAVGFSLALVWPVWRRVGAAYAVFILANVVPPMIQGGVLSLGRFTGTLFPQFLALALLVPPERRTNWIIAFAIGQGLIAAVFFTWRLIY